MRKRVYCRNCDYWDRESYCPANKSLGKCRRYAPVPISVGLSDDTDWMAIWPETGGGDWCGEGRET